METTRVIDGVLYVRSALPYSHDLRIHDLGNGHIEAVVQPRHAWSEADQTVESHRDALMAAGHIWEGGGWVPTAHEPRKPSERELLDRAAENRERASRRARTKVRRLAVSKLLDCLLTCTYRENVTDRARVTRDLDVFIKRLRRVLPGFEYIAVLERQKRGAWHVHIGCHRVQSHYIHKGVLVKSYDLLRNLWRAVVGADNGTVNVQKRRSRAPSKIARYIAKYIGKDLGEDLAKYANSYSASGRDLPKPIVLRVLQADTTAAVNEALALLLCDGTEGVEFHSAYLDGGGFFCSLSPPS